MILILVVTLSLADSGDSHRASDSHPEVMGICGIKIPIMALMMQVLLSLRVGSHGRTEEIEVQKADR